MVTSGFSPTCSLRNRCLYFRQIRAKHFTVMCKEILSKLYFKIMLTAVIPRMLNILCHFLTNYYLALPHQHTQTHTLDQFSQICDSCTATAPPRVRQGKTYLQCRFSPRGKNLPPQFPPILCYLCSDHARSWTRIIIYYRSKVFCWRSSSLGTLHQGRTLSVMAVPTCHVMLVVLFVGQNSSDRVQLRTPLHCSLHALPGDNVEGGDHSEASRCPIFVGMGLGLVFTNSNVPLDVGRSPCSRLLAS